MALQTSGPISFADLQGQYGGANPININEYYRVGSYVVTQVLVDSGVRWNLSSDYWAHNQSNVNLVTIRIYNSTTIQDALIGNVSSWSSGGFNYYRITYIGATSGYYFYSIRRTYYSARNTLVPSSGTVSMNQYYGGTN